MNECDYCNAEVEEPLWITLNTITLETLKVCDDCIIVLREGESDEPTQTELFL